MSTEEVALRRLYPADSLQAGQSLHPTVTDVTADPDQPDCPPSIEGWPFINEDAYQGLAGAFTRAVEPYSEADPVGILLHTLVAAGSLIGPGPHVMVEHLPHYPRTYALLVGKSAIARKGTAWNTLRYVLGHVDEHWILKRVKSGLSSGEGLVYQVRDPLYDKIPVREGNRKAGNIIGYDDILSDSGEPDKRLLILESEFASPLKVMQRDGNTLSSMLRAAWDHGSLSPLTKNDRIEATGAHISIIGHITRDELLRSLTVTERANGFANRFLIILVKRSKFLPSGKGTPPDILTPYFARFSRALESARTRGKLARDRETEDLWEVEYPKLENEIPGLTGAVLARAAAQVLRLSLIYALLDETEAQRSDPAIRVPHLRAALALWDYCKASVFSVFGDAVGDAVGDRLLEAIKSGHNTDSELYEVVGKHGGDKTRKNQALDLLAHFERIHSVTVPTGGRLLRQWHLGRERNCAICAKRRVEGPIPIP